MSSLFDTVKSKVKPLNRRIVFPEGLDERILIAASELSAAGLVQPVLIGNQQQIEEQARSTDVDIASCTIIDPEHFPDYDAMVDQLVERRKGKVDKGEAQKMLLDRNYFGTMLLYMQQADGLVSGAVHATAATVRPALQIIKTKEGIGKTSGVFVMVREREIYVFADCAINILPDSKDLAEIAVETAATARLFGLDPRVAMLSFSTKGSAQSEETEKVVRALELAKEKAPDLVIDGEFQFDAAFVPSIAAKKAPESVLKGTANVFVFPNLDAGNIGYKIAQRMGGFDAVGPILQGLNRPVNDLSRGCSSEDVFKLALITAAQAE